jgi:hypothetical protein
MNKANLILATAASAFERSEVGPENVILERCLTGPQREPNANAVVLAKSWRV